MTSLDPCNQLDTKKGEQNTLSGDILHVMVSYIVLEIERINMFFSDFIN